MQFLTKFTNCHHLCPVCCTMISLSPQFSYISTLQSQWLGFTIELLYAHCLSWIKLCSGKFFMNYFLRNKCNFSQSLQTTIHLCLVCCTMIFQLPQFSYISTLQSQRLGITIELLYFHCLSWLKLCSRKIFMKYFLIKQMQFHTKFINCHSSVSCLLYHDLPITSVLKFIHSLVTAVGYKALFEGYFISQVIFSVGNCSAKNYFFLLCMKFKKPRNSTKREDKTDYFWALN